MSTLFSSPVIFYDGQCGLCNFWVKWLLKKDKNKVFQFAPLQGETAKNKLPSFLATAPLNSIVLGIGNGYYQEAQAIFVILKKLPFPWKLFNVFKILPWFITNGIYRAVAQNRYLFFKRKTTCLIQVEHHSHRFLK